MIGNMTGGSSAMSRDIGEVIYRMKMLGFNAIRLPFTFAALAQVCASPCPVRVGPGLQGRVPLAGVFMQFWGTGVAQRRGVAASGHAVVLA